MNHSLSALRKPRPNRACAGMAAAAAMLLLTTANAWAFSCTWGGALSSSATNAANWRSCAAPSGIPGDGDDVFFPDNADRRTYDNDFAVPPLFRDVAFESGYTVSGGTLKWSRDALISVPFTATANVDASATFNSWYIQEPTSGVPGKAYFLGSLVSNAPVYVHTVPAVMTSGNAFLLVSGGGRLSLGHGFVASALIVKENSTLALSDKSNQAPPAVLGSATVTGTLSLEEAGSTLEYVDYPPGGYDSGALAATDAVILTDAVLRVVLDDPAQPQPVGTMRTLVHYTPGNLTGQFAGLPEGATMAASNAPGVHYRIGYGSRAAPRITLTRVPAPVPPAGGGTVAVPTLGHVGLALLSACMAAAGTLRRRRKV